MREMIDEDAAVIWQRGRRDVIAAPILAAVVLVAVLLIGDAMPSWLMNGGVPETVVRLYFVVPLVGIAWQAMFGWRMMRRTNEVRGNRGHDR